MFYSHTVDQSKFDLFASFLDSLIQGKESYKDFVDNVFRETHGLIVGEKSLYNIGRDTFLLVTHLANTQKDFFRMLDAENIQKNDYEHVYAEMKGIYA